MSDPKQHDLSPPRTEGGEDEPSPVPPKSIIAEAEGIVRKFRQMGMPGVPTELQPFFLQPEDKN